MKLKLCIAGSRCLDWMSTTEVWNSAVGNALFNFCADKGLSFSNVVYDKGLVVVHGGAPGIDTIAGLMAAEQGYEVKVFKADWHSLGKKAGVIRNMDMAHEADLIVAIWDGKSRGTRHMIEFCRSIHKPTRVFTVQS